MRYFRTPPIAHCLLLYGILRPNKSRLRARTRIQTCIKRINRLYWDYKVTPDLTELGNLALVAEVIVESELLRMESRGLHATLDHPALLAEEQDTALRKAK